MLRLRFRATLSAALAPAGATRITQQAPDGHLRAQPTEQHKAAPASLDT